MKKERKFNHGWTLMDTDWDSLREWMRTNRDVDKVDNLLDSSAFTSGKKLSGKKLAITLNRPKITHSPYHGRRIMKHVYEQ